MPNIRNIIIFTVIGLALVGVYFFFIKKPADSPSLVSTTPTSTTATPSVNATGQDNEIAQSFLTLLLNIKTIKLNDSIFSDIAFTSLHDSSITLTPDGNEGRPNPFAPLGSDNIATPVSTITTTPPVAPTPSTTQTTTPPSSSPSSNKTPTGTAN